jgi:hypothetical protein
MSGSAEVMLHGGTYMRFHGWPAFVGSLQVLRKRLECGAIPPKRTDSHYRAESDRISGCNCGASEPSTVVARDNASGGIAGKRGAGRSEDLLAIE